MWWWLVLLILPAGWSLCGWWYKKLWGYPLKWWALPFSQGALMFTLRLERWEKH